MKLLSIIFYYFLSIFRKPLQKMLNCRHFQKILKRFKTKKSILLQGDYKVIQRGFFFVMGVKKKPYSVGIRGVQKVCYHKNCCFRLKCCSFLSAPLLSLRNEPTEKSRQEINICFSCLLHFRDLLDNPILFHKD